MEKILVIKLGAKGDVIRTLPIAKALKEKHPDSILTWVTKENIKGILSTSQHIDKLLTLPYETEEEFDTLYNFDIEKEATDLAKKIKAKNKFGFYSEEGFATAFNLGSEYYLNTLFDDELKKTNKRMLHNII